MKLDLHMDRSGGGRGRLLDLCCKGGGAAVGYYRAGFDVVGVDIEDQPNFPFRFFKGDALDFLRQHGRDFDVIHASPPCQANLKGLAATNRKLGREYEHVDLVPAMREVLRELGKPYVIEQPCQGAKLIDSVRYCGSSFHLPIRRHRQFESSLPLVAPPCDHSWQTEKKYWTGWIKNGVRQKATVVQVYGNGGDRHEWGPALGIDWMTPDELTQAIPPAYTEHIGRQLLDALSIPTAAAA